MTRTVFFTHALLAFSVSAFSQEPKPSPPPPEADGSSDKAKIVTDNPLAVTVPVFSNTTCPIMGKPISQKLFVDTERGRINICCKGCDKKIVKDVETAYKTAFPTVKKVANKACPITGRAITKDSPVVVVQGHEVSVCCKECPKKVQEEAPLVLAKVTNPKVIDVGNKTCPVTSKPVEKSVFCLIGDNLVRLSSPDCIEEVKKDPRGALAKAKEISAKEAKAKSEGKTAPAPEKK